MTPGTIERDSEVHRTNFPSLWLVVFYLGLHQLVDQCFTGNYVFLFLRIAFLFGVVATLIYQSNTEAIKGIFLGRWLTSRKDWILALGFAVVTVLCVSGLSAVSDFPMGTPAPGEFVMTTIVPAVNEEIVFRGIVLAALLANKTTGFAGAVLLSTLVFVGCHDLGDPVPMGLLISLSLQSIIYGICFVATRCLPLCVFLHFLWNSLCWLLN